MSDNQPQHAELVAADHPDDYDVCDCRGLEEHARAMGTWPLLAIPKEPESYWERATKTALTDGNVCG